MVKKFQKKDEISFKKSFNKDENISKNKNCKKFTNFRTSILPKKLKEEEIKEENKSQQENQNLNSVHPLQSKK